MPHPADDQTIRQVLKGTRHIALLGASDKADRPSNEVMHFLLQKGYAVTPVNPRLAGKSIHGQTVLATLGDLPQPADMIELFLNSELVGQMQDELLKNPAPVIWMQIGVQCPELLNRAEAAGKTVIMDRCPKREIPRLDL